MRDDKDIQPGSMGFRDEAPATLVDFLAGEPLVVKLASKYLLSTRSFWHAIYRTACPPEATAPDMLAFMVIADQYGLNPLLREIWLIVGKGGKLIPTVSIDGWIKAADRHPQFDGFTTAENEDDKGNLVSATCTVHRKDRKHPTVVTEYLSECDRAGEDKFNPWNKKPRRMLRHKATIQGLRYGLGIGGIYDEDEAREIADAEVVEVTDVQRTVIESGRPSAEALKAKLAAAKPDPEPDPEPDPAPDLKPEPEPEPEPDLTNRPALIDRLDPEPDPEPDGLTGAAGDAHPSWQYEDETIYTCPVCDVQKPGKEMLPGDPESRCWQCAVQGDHPVRPDGTAVRRRSPLQVASDARAQSMSGDMDFSEDAPREAADDPVDAPAEPDAIDPQEAATEPEPESQPRVAIAGRCPSCQQMIGPGAWNAETGTCQSCKDLKRCVVCGRWSHTLFYATGDGACKSCRAKIMAEPEGTSSNLPGQLL